MDEDIQNKTLEELDGKDWGEPNFGSSVVINCHRLRRVPLRQFRIEDLRLMIGQSIGLEYLMPIALQHLRANPFTEGNFYPGDLVEAVLRQDEGFWRENPAQRTEVQNILSKLTEVPKELEQSVTRSRRIQGVAEQLD